MPISARLRDVLPRRIRRRWHAAKLRRLARHLPEGSHLSETGSTVITSGVNIMDHFDKLERSYRFWRLRRWWRRLIRPIRPNTIRGRYRDLRSLHDRARHGIGPHDTWDLGHYLARVAAHGLQHLAESGAIPNNTTDPVYWIQTLEDHAIRLEAWCTPGDEEAPVVRLRGAQGALRWIAYNLDGLHARPTHDGPTTAWRAATQRRRHGIADNDCADLGRYLSTIAARGMTEIADRGFGYPMNRIDGHEWQAELHRSAEALDWWVRPARRIDSEDDRKRILGEAKQGWRWIADNLNDLWD